ncbi:MAG: Holliday junction resolvase RuvX [Candidatus Binataceae bacterium]
MHRTPIAALDVGRKRIGIAVCPANSLAAYPVATIERRSLAQDLKKLAAELGSRDVGRVVVGLPLNMDGSEGPNARAVRIFAERLDAALGIPVELFDERLTSFEAEQRLGASSRRGAKNKHAVDAVAAAVILEGWLAGCADSGR